MNEGTNLKACVLISIFLLGMACATAAGRTIYVDDDGPADFNTIQAAIDDSNDGDTVVVADGTYTGPGNRDIDFKGKAITVLSANGPENCIIDCNATESDRYRGFFLHSGEDANSEIIGFTITNGYAPITRLPPPGSEYLSEGGAIFLDNSSPTISNCIITANIAGVGYVYGYGGGIYIRGGSPTITNCIITANFADVEHHYGYGGGICIMSGSPTITNCIFSRNLATYRGGGIYSSNGGPTITNCTFSGNQTHERCGGGILCSHGSITVTNCILWGNIGSGGEDAYAQFCYVVPTALFLNFNCIQWPGALNPLFADANNDDYHLQSQAGRWDPNSQSWVQDSNTSPYIDAGDPMSPIGFEPFPNGGVINMGAYGSTAEASKSYFGWPVCEIIVAGDVNGDCIVNYLDFRIMALNWLRDENM
ncbi:MAG: right-handed parallel beta-helix repeat-containing protein [Planctomycetota bacterium]|jgi:predicted outer membrane repeat protein